MTQTENGIGKADRAHQLFTEIKTMVAGRTMDVFELGRILYEIKEGALFEALGYTSFLEFVNQPEISIGKSSAYYYVDLYRVFIVDLGLTFQDIGDIPHTKLYPLLDCIDRDNAAHLLGMARELAISDLNIRLKEEGFKEIKGEFDLMTKGQKLFLKYKKLPEIDKREFDVEYRRYNNYEQSKG